MSPSTTVFVLGLYILLMGIIGYVRTKSPTAIGFNGVFGLVCIVLGWLLSQGKSVLTITEIWVGLIALAGITMGVRRLMAPKRQTTPILIFASMALFSLIALIILINAGGSAQG